MIDYLLEHWLVSLYVIFIIIDTYYYKLAERSLRMSKWYYKLPGGGLAAYFKIPKSG